jgi:hypothetical protein
MHQIGLCMNTGRCGTTYLAQVLGAAYGEDCDIFHEDIAERHAKARRYLWHFDQADLARIRRDSDIENYLTQIRKRSSKRPYISLGFPGLPLVPLLLASFPGQIRLLHLIRDPLSVAASMTNLGQYDPSMSSISDPGYLELPNPVESRCAHPEYAATWDSMSRFEKGLWRWTEYNLLALAIHERHPDVPYMRLTSATLFKDPDAPRRVADFYGLPVRTLTPQPRFRNETNPNLTALHGVGEEWRCYVQYPHILELAEKLGVPVKTEGLAERMKAYATPSAWELARYRWRLRCRPRWVKEKVIQLASRLRRIASSIL